MAVFCEYTKVAKNKPVYDKLTVHVQISFLAIRYPNIQRAVNKQELHTPGHDLCFPCEAIRAFPILKLPLLQRQTYFYIFLALYNCRIMSAWGIIICEKFTPIFLFYFLIFTSNFFCKLAWGNYQLPFAPIQLFTKDLC